MYHFLDWFFIVFHTLVTLFNLFGWICRRTRKWNLVLLLLTGFSWFVLGIYYGWGYCPLTDWHFNVLDKLGEDPKTNSYIGYLIQRFFDLYFNPVAVDIVTLVCFLIALVISAALNIRDRMKKISAQHPV